MRSDQRRQHFVTLQGRERCEIGEDDTLFQYTEKLLIKGGEVRWNSTYHMLHRAIQLQTAIDRCQISPPQDNSREDSYSPALDRTSAQDWEDVRDYLRLLRHFMEATLHLEGYEGIEDRPGKSCRGFKYTMLRLTRSFASSAMHQSLSLKCRCYMARIRWTSTSTSSYMRLPTIMPQSSYIQAGRLPDLRESGARILR